MNITDKVFIWLSISDIDLSTLYEFMSLFDSIDDIWNLDKYQGKIMYCLSGKDFQNFISIRDSGILDKAIADLEKSDINHICYYDKNFPKCFKILDFPPLVIYYKGDLSLLNQRNISIVGTRLCTRYGKEQTERFAYELSKAGFNIISGLAEGVDGFAHKGALRANGKTISIVANGLNTIYPAINVNLAQEIVDAGGLVLSANYPDFNIKNFSFVQRNRLIAAAGEGVLITEAGVNSGALHTVNFALDLGKEVFVLPGNCNSPSSEGTNNLIKKYFSTCVTKPQEIIETLNLNYKLIQDVINTQKPIQKIDKELMLNDLEKVIYDLVQLEDVHFDEILEKTKIDTKKLMVLLTTMEIRGLIKKLPGNYYGRKD